MKLRRIRDRQTARRVSAGIARFNQLAVSPGRVLQRKHYAITSGGALAGWIGLERRSPGVLEMCHLSVLPAYRRRGLAEAASRRCVYLAKCHGGRYVYTRVRRNNAISRHLMAELGFHRIKGASVLVFGRAI